jgi:branched-chain amino acid transport system permease protein
MFSLLFRGIILGSIYGLASIGLSLQWGVLRNLNFSHGACITVGTYVMWASLNLAGLPFFLGMLILLLTMFALGIGIEWLTVRPFFAKNDTNIFFSTVALSTILAQICLIIFGGREKVLRPLFDGLFEAGPFRATYHELFCLFVTLITQLILWFILMKTKTGMSIRAVSQDQTGAILNGINTRKVYAITMGVATVLAGLAGMLLGPIYFINPMMGDSPMTKAFIIVILGGLGSLKGTIVAAFIVALIEVLVGMYIGVTWAPICLFAIMVLILIFKPDGLFGLKVRQA